MQKFYVGRKKQKAKLCRRKGEQAPKTVLSGEMEKSAQFTSLWSQTLVECKEALQGEKKRKHVFNDRVGGKAQNTLQNKNAHFLDLSPASQQVSAESQQQVGPNTALALVLAHLDWVSLQNLLCWSLPESLVWRGALSATV